MFTVELMGGLGNQLFQLITLMAYSKKCNQPFAIKKVKSLSGQYVTRDVYWNTLFKSLKDNLVDDDSRSDKYQIVKEKGFNYEELPMRTTDTKLYGYFQSYKYFEQHSREIFDFLKFDEYKKSVAKSYDNSKEFISLHFRVGDYVKLQHAHPLMSYNYYCNAIQHIITQTNKDDWTVVYFCEENDINYVMDKINKIQKRFPKITFIKVNSNLTDWEQMLLMSTGNHNIIANSSFSWWGAYLNNNENKIVCYPNKWFGKIMQNNNTSDLFPPTWTECDAYDLSNVYYINLTERVDRKKAVEDELYKLNWKYERFNAIKLADGRIGCSMSHYRLLEMAKKNNMEYIVIVEDDIMFTKPEQYAEMLEGFIRSNMEYDVLLLAGNLRPPFTKINDNLLKITKGWTTTGYIVKKRYYDKLMANIKEGVTKLMANPAHHHLYAIDAYWQKLQETDNWFILMPRTVTQRPNYSTIEKRFTDYNRLMLD